MADVAITVAALSQEGTDVTTGLTAMTTGNDYIYPNATQTAIIYLIATGTVTVTFETPFTGAGLDLEEETIAMVDTDVLILPPRQRKFFNNSDGNVILTVSASGVSVGIYTP